MIDAIPQIIGVGNPMRGDDGVGAEVVALLRSDGIPALAFDGDGTELMEMWAGLAHVIVVDATQSTATAGTIYRFDANAEELPAKLFHHSTHQFGVIEAVEMARILNRLPSKLTVYGIEGGDFSLGAQLSSDVKQAAKTVAQHIKTDISSASVLS